MKIITRGNKKRKNMSSSLVLRKSSEFKMDAHDSKTGHYTNVSSEDYKGKWHVVCFIQQTLLLFVQQKLLLWMQNMMSFKNLVLKFCHSTDTKFSQKICWNRTFIKGLKLTIGADPTRCCFKSIWCYDWRAKGVALRGRFLINPDGVVVAQEVQAQWLERNVHEF